MNAIWQTETDEEIRCTKQVPEPGVQWSQNQSDFVLTIHVMVEDLAISPHSKHQDLLGRRDKRQHILVRQAKCRGITSSRSSNTIMVSNQVTNRTGTKAITTSRMVGVLHLVVTNHKVDRVLRILMGASWDKDSIFNRLDQTMVPTIAHRILLPLKLIQQ